MMKRVGTAFSPSPIETTSRNWSNTRTGTLTLCEGPRIRLWLNGTLTVDYTEQDARIERTGIIALQIHGGAKAKVYY